MNGNLFARINYGLPASEWKSKTFETYYDDDSHVTLKCGMLSIIPFIGRSNYEEVETLKQYLETKRIPYKLEITQDETPPIIVFVDLPERYNIRTCDLCSANLSYRNNVIYYDDIPISVIEISERNIAKK